MEPARRVQEALDALGFGTRVVTFPASTATAEAAAGAVGCELGQIVKTLLFIADGRPTVALAAGDSLIDTAKLARLLGVGRKRVKMAAPDEVLRLTGFEVGAVSPVGMGAAYDTVVDETLRTFDRVWAAAGTTSSVFEAAPEKLAEALHGQWADVRKAS
jgi:Cys-tRNA(Pro) deacylase